MWAKLMGKKLMKSHWATASCQRRSAQKCSGKPITLYNYSEYFYISAPKTMKCKTKLPKTEMKDNNCLENSVCVSSLYNMKDQIILQKTSSFVLVIL